MYGHYRTLPLPNGSVLSITSYYSLGRGDNLNLLGNNLNDLSDEVPLQVRQKKWFIHDDASGHYSLTTHQ